MRMSFLLVITLVSICLFTSCRQYRYVYGASKLNTPILKERGDARLNISYSGGNAHGYQDSSRNHGLDFQAAYAISNNFALMASHYSRSEADLFLESSNFFNRSFVTYKRQRTDIGAGFFYKGKGNILLSIYAGYAFGKFHFDDNGMDDTIAYRRFFASNFGRFFIQPGFSILLGNASIDFSLRLNAFNFYNTKTDYTDTEMDDLNLKKVSAKTYRLGEPSLTLQLPFPKTNWLKIESSVSFAGNGSHINVRGINGSIGLTANPGKWWSKK